VHRACASQLSLLVTVWVVNRTLCCVVLCRAVSCCVVLCRAVQVAFVPDRHPMSPAWVHDFAATDKYAVIIEHPLYMQLGSLLLNTPATHIFSECLCQVAAGRLPLITSSSSPWMACYRFHGSSACFR
jgi:hypothetical protein